MTRPRPTGLCVARVHIVTGARAKAGEREGAQQSASERERWKAERNEHTRCSSVDDSSLPWGARATHTRPLVVHVRSCATQCAGNRQRSTRPHSDLYTSRGTATGCIYTGVYMRATNTLTRSRRSLAVIAHTSTTQLLAARCGIIYPII